jgi:pimeloyl-ACP methyl ester carboxylesterase
MIRSIGRGVSLVALIVGLAVAGALAVHTFAQHRTAEATAIRTPYGIDEERFVRINGIDQWMTIRGQDRRNPVLLILHGGPGSPESYLLHYFQPMERRYVVAQWDERGGGKTLARAGGLVDPNIDMAMMVADGTAVSEYLRRRLHTDKIVLVGHSWGSILGVRMALARPDLYSALVGTGQTVGTTLMRQRWQYADLLARAQAAGDTKDLAELRDEAGPPPWPDGSARLMHMVHAAGPYLPPTLSYGQNVRAVLTAPHWSLTDVLALQHGMAGMLQGKLWTQEVRDVDIGASDGAFAMPVVVIQGGQDITTPAEFARAWLDRIQAPAKAFVVLPGQGHEVLSYDNAAFTRALDTALLPILNAKASTR